MHQVGGFFVLVKIVFLKFAKTPPMNISETYRITDFLRQTFDGKPWYGPSVMDTLSNLTFEESLNQLPSSHTVIEILEHMIAWRTFVIKRLQGDTEFEIDQEQSFKHISSLSNESWRDTIQRLNQTQEDLLQILSQTSDEKLDEMVAGREYNFDKMLHGIIHHDIYHIGQIGLLRKM